VDSKTDFIRFTGFQSAIRKAQTHTLTTKYQTLDNNDLSFQEQAFFQKIPFRAAFCHLEPTTTIAKQ